MSNTMIGKVFFNLENIHSCKQLVETEIDGEKRLDCPFFDQCGFRRKYTQVHVLKAHIFKEHCSGVQKTGL